MASWKRHLPGWEFIEWSEANADLSGSAFARTMLERRKWAFVTDYVRAEAVRTRGGVYMDTDVEVLLPLDRFLGHRAFTGFETRRAPFTAVFGAEAGHPWLEMMTKLYRDLPPPPPDADLSLFTNTRLVTDLLVRDYGVLLNDRYQELKDGLAIYPSHYFCYRHFPLKSHALHHMEGSWTSGGNAWMKRMARAILGPRAYRELAEAAFELRRAQARRRQG